MFEDMGKHLLVKFVENPSNGTQHWLGIVKQYMRVALEISIVDFVVYGKYMYTSLAKDSNDLIKISTAMRVGYVINDV